MRVKLHQSRYNKKEKIKRQQTKTVREIDWANYRKARYWEAFDERHARKVNDNHSSTKRSAAWLLRLSKQDFQYNCESKIQRYLSDI